MSEPFPEQLSLLVAQLADEQRPAIDRLRAGADLQTHLARWLPAVAEAARQEEGASWTTIGHALTITRQAAQQRFGRPTRKVAALAYNEDPGDARAAR